MSALQNISTPALCCIGPSCKRRDIELQDSLYQFVPEFLAGSPGDGGLGWCVQACRDSGS